MAWMFPVCPGKRGMGERHMLMVIQAGEDDNFIAYCPEWTNSFKIVKSKFTAICKLLDDEYEKAKPLFGDKKAYKAFTNKSSFGNLLWER
jgi:hypothetical protein